MRASRTPMERNIPYQSPDLVYDGAEALQKRIVKYIKGVRGERKNPVTQKQICSWFRSTDGEFVKKQITELVFDGRIRICQRSFSSGRKHNGSYVYEVAEEK